MITVEKALQIVLENTPVLDSVTMPILEARSMVLAEDIVSFDDIPPFDMSLLDGYAMRSEDVLRAGQSAPITMKLDGEAKVGCTWPEIVQPGHAIKIAAGAPLPEGTDTIVSSDFAARESAHKLKVYKYEKPGENIYGKGADIEAGTPVFSRGRILTGADIGCLAAIGKSDVQCHRRPKVSFFASGNDLIAPDQPMQDGKIRAGNSFVLQCQLHQYGALPNNLGVVGADSDEVKAYAERAMASDMFITTAGSSMDDFEFIKGLLQRIGMDMKFWKVAIKPGKSLIFGTINQTPVFGMPGNYLSSMVILEEFVRPAIMKMQGKRDLRRMEVVAKLDRDVKGGGGVTHFIRAEVKVTEDGFLAIPAGSRATGSIIAFSSANGFIVVPPEMSFYNAGDLVHVQVISEQLN